MAFKMKGHTLPGIKQRSASPILQETDSRGNISASAKLDKRDDAVFAKHVDEDKAGGKGSEEKDKAAVVRAQRRSVVQGSYQKTKKELLKEANDNNLQRGKGGVGGKLKNFFTSKKNLRSKVTATRLKDVKGAGLSQTMSTKTKDALGGDKYTGVTRDDES